MEPKPTYLRENSKQIKSHRRKLSQDIDIRPVYYPDKQSAAKKFFHNDNFLNIKFHDLDSSQDFRHLKYGFLGEDDFEEFKEELINFKKLKNECSVEFLDKSPKTRRKKLSSIISTKLARKSLSAEKSPKSARKSVRFNDNIMEFLNTDEHFQEFDRVFETFKSKEISDNIDQLRWSWKQYSDENDADSDEDDNRTIQENDESLDELDDEDLMESTFEESFADFFDNDEDFKEFEVELQKLNSKRRSRVLLNKINRTSGCDIVTELKAFCDNDPIEKYEAMAAEPHLWNSGGEWDYIFKKIKRRSCLSCSSLAASCDSIQEDVTIPDCDCVFHNDVKTKIDKCSSCGNLQNIDNQNGDCHFTCHQNCGALVRLGCKSKSSPDLAGQTEPPLLEPTDTLQTVSSDGSSEPTNEKDETDSGYRSGTIPEEKLPRKPSQATLNREELKLKIEEYNLLVPGAEFSLKEDKGQAFQGFLRVTLNLSRPICMSLGVRPPSIYEALTKEHIIEQNTMTMSFYMPRDTMKSIHVPSVSSSKEVIALLLKKFHILDNPRKFALYEQELSSRGKIVKLRRVPDVECPLLTSLEWDPDKLSYIRLVLQENETGDIMWDAFSLPELSNFLIVLDREEKEYCSQLEYKYKVMRKIIQSRLKELRKEKLAEKRKSLGLVS
ncbi:uncharacterized protein LOC143078606 isoform X1 [Mytilus galloprovincialis]|uniref:uncharacterized protein LOC143078606 isoform X1 n=2 Tax=Mytilus galloprovincialis TaxID=29158 RepID=UPI003F7BEE65